MPINEARLSEALYTAKTKPVGQHEVYLKKITVK